MNVSIHFTIDIDPEEWEGRKTGSPVNIGDGETAVRIATEVRRHAEEVVRSLYADMGWAVTK